MAHVNKKFPSLPLSSQPLLHSFIIFKILFCLLYIRHPRIDALYFNFSSFEFNHTHIELEGDAHYNTTTASISLNHPIENSVGRALYHQPMQLWEVSDNTIKVADFTTHFSFIISAVAGVGSGHGLAFVLIHENAPLYNNRDGGLLGLFESVESGTSESRKNNVVAVEFDTDLDSWDQSMNHLGIDVNSLRSEKWADVMDGFIDRGTANVWVVYNSTSNNLSASLTFDAGPRRSSVTYDVFHIVDLSTVLPQRVRVGFTAATGKYVENDVVYSWGFNSSMGTFDAPPSSLSGRNKVGLVVGVTSGLFVVILVSSVALYCFKSRKNILAQTPLAESTIVPPEDGQVPPKSPHIEYVGPKRYSYLELSKATNNFDKELKLGEGGFGDVYQGNLAYSNEKVAVKRFRSGSSQGEKEYVSEVNVISMLKHKNLVQLKGWCHENGELILVYEFMSNRSLDLHIFGNKLPLLTWPKRYKITADLASALQYLQDGCDPLVLHRDIKSSNIMLDSNFTAKLGDFGLARLTDQDQSLKTTVPAGTLGYLAPEVIISGKVSKASDIYSFGVVSLEIASGRRPANNSKENPSKLNLVEWVWYMYGKRSIHDAIDARLNGEFDKDEARRLMVVGLWCCHPDPDRRPSIRQVQAVLNFEAAEPSLPPTIPRPSYNSSTMNMSLLSSNASMSTEAGGSTTVSNMYTSSSPN